MDAGAVIWEGFGVNPSADGMDRAGKPWTREPQDDLFTSLQSALPPLMPPGELS